MKFYGVRVTKNDDTLEQLANAFLVDINRSRPWECPNCKTMNAATSSGCHKCYAPVSIADIRDMDWNVLDTELRFTEELDGMIHMSRRYIYFGTYADSLDSIKVALEIRDCFMETLRNIESAKIADEDVKIRSKA